LLAPHAGFTQPLKDRPIPNPARPTLLESASAIPTIVRLNFIIPNTALALKAETGLGYRAYSAIHNGCKGTPPAYSQKKLFPQAEYLGRMPKRTLQHSLARYPARREEIEPEPYHGAEPGAQK